MPFTEGDKNINRNGRPKGSISITTEIKKRLNELTPDKKRTYLEEFISYVMDNYKSDSKLLRLIWNYVEGMPRQSLDVGLDETIGGIKIEIVKNKNDISKDTSNNSIPKELGTVSKEGKEDNN